MHTHTPKDIYLYIWIYSNNRYWSVGVVVVGCRSRPTTKWSTTTATTSNKPPLRAAAAAAAAVSERCSALRHSSCNLHSNSFLLLLLIWFELFVMNFPWACKPLDCDRRFFHGRVGSFVWFCFCLTGRAPEFCRNSS